MKKFEEIRFIEVVVMLLIMMIPVIGLIMLFYWSFSKRTHPEKQYMARIGLLLYGVGILAYSLAIWIFP